MEKYCLGSIVCNDKFKKGYSKIDKVATSKLDIPCYSLSISSSDKETLSNYLYLLESSFSDYMISIDYRLLDSENLLNELKKRVDKKQLQAIRIIGDNYKLNLDMYKKIDFFEYIYVDDYDKSIPGFKIVSQNNIYKYSFDTDYDCYNVNRNLSDEEIKFLVRELNSGGLYSKPKLNYMCYNPVEYRNFIQKLKEAGIKRSVKICLLGNPIKDKIVDFTLNDILKNDIEIIYHKCHDYIKYYNREPFAKDKLLEDGKRISLNDYLNILNGKNKDENIHSTVMEFHKNYKEVIHNNTSSNISRNYNIDSSSNYLEIKKYIEENIDLDTSLYDILGVLKEASFENIRKARNRLIYGIDSIPFWLKKKVEIAYIILSSPMYRKVYDSIINPCIETQKVVKKHKIC